MGLLICGQELKQTLASGYNYMYFGHINNMMQYDIGISFWTDFLNQITEVGKYAMKWK